MAENIDPTVQREFPTSAKPVFIRLGLLLAALLSIVVWLYIDAHSNPNETLSTEKRQQVEGIINQSHETDLRLGD